MMLDKFLEYLQFEKRYLLIPLQATKKTLKTFHFYLRTESSEDISKADKKLSKLYC
jgi:integrase/recombinase XerC